MAFQFRFRPRILPTLLAIAGVLVTASLGDWQLRRAAYKAELQERLDVVGQQPPVHLSSEPVHAEDLAFYRIEAQGEFRPELTILLDNRVHNGVVGYEVITPLQLAGGARHVLVNRGWIKAPPTRDELPDVPTPPGTVTVEGIALPPPGRVFQLAAQAERGVVWQHLSLERAREQLKLELQPLVVQQRNELADSLARDWPRPDAGISQHRAYALQWFTMCGAILVLYVVLNVRKQPQSIG
jgi:surfeit locus 1 family protein